jgi:hypothetical protein
MVKLVDRKQNKVSTIIHINQKNEFDESQPIGIEKDYRKMLEDKIKERKLKIETNEIDIKGTSKENIQKKRKWMGEVIKSISEIKDILEKTELIEIKMTYRTGKVVLNDIKNIIIKSKAYDEAKIVKSGFKLDVDFFPRSQALNNKRDCYLVQLLGNTREQESLMKYYNLDTLMEFIIDYCSEYIAEFSSKRGQQI